MNPYPIMFNKVAFNVFHDYNIAKLSLYYEVVYSQRLWLYNRPNITHSIMYEALTAECDKEIWIVG